MRGDGRIFQRGGVHWVAYYFRGREHRESAGRSEKDARKLLKRRLKEIAGDRFIGPQEDRLTAEALLDSYVTHLEQKGAKSLGSVVSHLKPVREFFSLSHALDVTTDKLRAFITARQDVGKEPATINRSLQAFRAAFRLALKEGRLSRVPYFPTLREENTRTGFFERGEFAAVAMHLPSPVDDVARFAYLTGWRKSEILGLTWGGIDRAAGEARLQTSKNGRGRLLPLAGELRELIERRWAAREYRKPDGTSAICEYVFHRHGAPVVDFKRSWAAACKAAGVPGRLFHDLRRTAVRDMIRAGAPQSVAMSISGHRTMSMFVRYNITSGEDMLEALKRTEDYRDRVPVERTTGVVVPMPQTAARS